MLLLTRGTHSSHGRLPAAMAACQQVEIVLPAGAKSKPFPNFPQRGTPLISGLLSAVPKRRREALNMRFILFPALCQLEGLQRLRFVHQLQRPQAQKEVRLHGDSPEEETEEERKRGACVGLDKC